MSYWIDLFTGATWEEFRRAGSRITGFRKSMRNQASKIKPGDIFLCYLTGVMRWVGALEVVGPSNDRTQIWSQEEFPVRFEVQPLITLDPEYGVPMSEFEACVSFYRGPQDRGKFRGFVRSSPRLFQIAEDGDFILQALKQALEKPVFRPVDPKKLARKPLYRVSRKAGKTKREILVAVPEPEEASQLEESVTAFPEAIQIAPEKTQHVEIQYRLLKLGTDSGYNLWVARNDRSKIWNGQKLGDLPGMVDELPTQFNEPTTRTIELIDVLWLKGNSIVAAFEVEVTSPVFSGLLRMSDLLALQPNLEIKLYIVAPDERRDKVEQEILRPTFTLRDKPLTDICGFIPVSKLTEFSTRIKQMGIASWLKAGFLEAIAEYFGPED